MSVGIKNITRKIGFYARRLRQEKLTKLIAASTASLALVLQLTVGVLPFTNTPVGAVGDDNIIRNGVTSKEQLLSIYDSGSDGTHTDIKKIYTYFGVSRQDIANATVGSYKTNDFQGTLKTLGRTNWPNTGRTAVNIDGTTIYTGPFLDNANSTAFTMPALIGKRSVDGQWFAITMNCGNIVYVVPPPKPVPPAPQPVPVTRCDSLKIIQAGRTEFQFSPRYTAEHATFKSVEYVITDENAQVIARTTSNRYVQETPGTYTVQAYVTFIENGKEKVVTNVDCTGTFTVKAPVTPISTVPKCDVIGKENLPKDSHDCFTPCPVVGKENIRNDSNDCFTPCPIVGKENLRKDSNDCVTPVITKPVVTAPPQELPKTGLGEDILKVTGVGSIIAAVGYYAASRRNLLNAFLSR
jgi:hypothetical protein